MDKTIDVTIPVEPEVAAALTDARNREAVGRLVSPRAAAARGSEPARAGDRGAEGRSEGGGPQRCGY